MHNGLPAYRDLDGAGEARRAAERMEARAAEPSSLAMFEALVRPLLTERVQRVLEVGCGTAALSRRIAATGAEVCASDKSAGMLAFAAAKSTGVALASWDVTQPERFPFGDRPFDLIVSSVMVPYLDDAQTEALVEDLARRLSPRGVLAFVEQDLLSDHLAFPDPAQLLRVFEKDRRPLRRTLALGLRPLLRSAGLSVRETQSFLWKDPSYGAYLHDLIGAMADAAVVAGRFTDDERSAFLQELEHMAQAGDFFYGIVYHAMVGERL